MARARLTARAAVAAAVIAVAVALGLSARGVLAADRAEPRLLDRPPAPTVSATATPRDAATGGGGPSPGGVAAPAPPAVTGGSGAAGPAGVVVHVVGRVRRPGLVRLPAGSRVADAVTAAGGVAPPARLDQLNLARPLADGEMLVVPGPGVAPVPAAAAGSAAGAGGAATAVAVDLNQATEAQFDTLPGVGPVTAGRILAWRAAHGRFSSVDELAEVPGIGPRTLERLRPLVRV